MSGDFVHIRAALAGPIPDLVLAQWMLLAAEHRASGTYASAVSFARLYPYDDELSVAVENHAPHAQVLEDGHGGFHLPSVIDWGAAVGRGTAKQGKKGRYMIIPFRHGTPGREGVSSGRGRTMMPQAVYRAALQMAKTTGDARKAALAVLEAHGARRSKAYSVMALREPTAARGPNLRELAARAQKQEGQPGYTWRAGLYGGLARKVQKGPSGRESGSWMTFRVLSEHSNGWYVPARSGYGFARRTVDAVKDQVRDLLGAAAREDMVALVRTGLREVA